MTCRWSRPRGPLLALLATALLCAVATGCGTSKVTSTSAQSSDIGAATAPGESAIRTAPSGGYVHEDGDQDGDDGHHAADPGQDDGSLLESYPAKASPAQAQAIAEVVKRYYAASLASNGAGACALLSPSLASGLAAEGTGSGAHGQCATAMSQMLAQQHAHLVAEEPASMVVTAVRLNGATGLVVIGFKHAPESELIVQHEGGAWRVGALFDSLVP